MLNSLGEDEFRYKEISLNRTERRKVLSLSLVTVMLVVVLVVLVVIEESVLLLLLLLVLLLLLLLLTIESFHSIVLSVRWILCAVFAISSQVLVL